jgi:hypothetical protein
MIMAVSRAILVEASVGIEPFLAAAGPATQPRLTRLAYPGLPIDR